MLDWLPKSRLETNYSDMAAITRIKTIYRPVKSSKKRRHSRRKKKHISCN